jgi:hypothetical protein
MKVTVKVIQLNRRFKLYKEHGMKHAIRFSSWDPKIGRVESFMREHFGPEYVWGHNSQTQWKTHWGKVNGDQPRPYFIGVRDEEMIFTAKLAGII